MFQKISSRVSELNVYRILRRIEKRIMDLQTGFADLQTAVAQVSATEQSVLVDIAALQAQIAAGSPITGDQLEAIATQINGVSSGLQAAITPPVTTTTTTSTSTDTSSSSPTPALKSL